MDRKLLFPSTCSGTSSRAAASLLLVLIGRRYTCMPKGGGGGGGAEVRGAEVGGLGFRENI